MKNLTNEEVVKSFIEIHGNRYDYSHVLYKNMRNKVIIICKEHGEFQQLAHHHIAGRGCRLCANKIINVNNGKGFSQEQFIEIIKSKNIPNLSFDKVIYQGKRKDIIVTCSIHGDYITKAEMLLKGNGCSKCRSSVGEDNIRDILKLLHIEYETQKGFQNLSFIRTLKFDFYLTDYNACIEFDGEQHFKSVNFWGGEKGFKSLQIKDIMKNKYCELNNIPLLRIKFNDLNIENKIKIFLENLKK